MIKVHQNNILATALLYIAVLSSVNSLDILPPPCDSLIYCHGSLLHTVQMSEIYPDSKHFVDMSLKSSPSVTLENFAKFMNETNQTPTKDQVRAFVEGNFDEPSSEFVPWNPPDWNEDPDFLNKIVDPELEEWGKTLVGLWKNLGRKTSMDVQNNPEKYSLIYLPQPVIVPGGRFREIYYWDSYWTIEGLLLSEMHETAKGMIDNFMDFVRQFGMVPNGGRIYYTRRSQPPYLISMVKLYFDYTGDLEFVRKHMEIMEEEFNFWENHRSTAVRDTNTGKVHKVYLYNVEAGGPRPEAYKEDYKLASNLTSKEAKEKMYVELKSGAESGWDYSTRWFVKGDSNLGTLADINTTAIAPVDLNSLLCRNARILSDFYHKLGIHDRAVKYDDIANVKNQTMAELFWDEEDGIWYDINVHTMTKRRFFFLSNVHPLWSGCYGLEGKRENTVKRVLDYLEKQKVVDYIGGVPTSLKNSSQQWDFPNAWAPLQHLVIMGLHNSQSLNPDVEQMAFELAEKWIRTNYIAYKETKAMFEKYDVTIQGVAGEGGEYDVQLGFGWTNGVAMKFLNTFGDRLTATTGGAKPIFEAFSVVLFLPTILMIFISGSKDL